MRSPYRFRVLFIIALLLLPIPLVSARGKGFKDVVKHIEKNYQAKKTRIPMLGVANFFVKLIRPAGVKGFKVAVFQDQDFSPVKDAVPFHTAMREAYIEKKGWKPLVQMNSRRDGENSRVFIMFKENKKDVEVALTTLENREASVIEVKFSPDKMAQFLDNPKIMGISLGKGVRNGGNTTATNTANPNPADNTTANNDVPPPPPRRDAEPVAKPGVTILPDNAVAPDKTESAIVRPALKTQGVENAELKAEIAGINEVNTIRIETRLVNLNVKAVDEKGLPINDLKPADFTIIDDETKEEIAHFRPVTAPVNLVMMLDLSGSTKNKRKPMVEAARRFIDALPANDRMAVVAFTRRYHVLAKLTSDKLALKASLERVKDIGGGTAYYDSMWKAFDDLGQLPEARKAIVVLTDGEDESLIGNAASAHTFDELLQRASEDDVTVYPIYFKSGSVTRGLSWIFSGNMTVGGDSHPTRARKQLEALAEQTGGEIINAQSEEALAAAYDKVASELHSLYSLAYSPDKIRHDGSFRKISVQVKRAGVKTKTRKGYFDK